MPCTKTPLQVDLPSVAELLYSIRAAVTPEKLLRHHDLVGLPEPAVSDMEASSVSTYGVPAAAAASCLAGRSTQAEGISRLRTQ